MKISETSITKKIKKAKEPKDIERLLKKHNWHILGIGQESSVAEHPNKKYVIKIFKKDSEFVVFKELCDLNQNNPHFPKFYDRIHFIPHTTDWAYVRTEKLEPVEYGTFLKNYESELLYLLERAIHFNLPNSLQALDSWLYVHVNHAYHLELFRTQQGSRVFNTDVWQHVDKPSHSWQHAATVVADTAKQLGLSHIDSHPGNFMLRGQTLVFIDPFYG